MNATGSKANPSLGSAVNIDGLRRFAVKAKEDPSSQNEFLRFSMCIWTESHSVWMPLDKWDLCNEAVVAEMLKGRQCFGGLDLSSTTDITAFVLLFPPFGDDTKWRVLPFFFLPEDNITKRVKKDRVPYDVWHRQGLFNLTPGNVIDTAFVRAQINELAKDYKILEIGFDKTLSADLTPQLENDGMTMVTVHPGEISETPPLKKLMELVLRQEFAHGGNPVLRWMVGNLVVRVGATGQLKPDKEKSRERIDGISALLDGLARAIVVPIQQRASLYADVPYLRIHMEFISLFSAEDKQAIAEQRSKPDGEPVCPRYPAALNTVFAWMAGSEANRRWRTHQRVLRDATHNGI